MLTASLGGCGRQDPLERAKELQRSGRFEASLEPLRELLSTRPDSAEVQFLYGHALVATRQLSYAQFALRAAMQDPEWLVPAGIELASAALATNNPEESIAALDRVLEAEPDHLYALLLRARAHAISRQNYEATIADAEHALEVDPDNFEALTLRAVGLLGLERAEEADAALQDLDARARKVDLAPSEAATYCGMRAVFAKESDKPDEADEIFGECLEMFPLEPVLVSEALKFFDSRGENERSLEVLRKALAEAPSAGHYRRALAERLRASGEVDEAEQVLREGTELENPLLSVEAWVDLASHYHALENYSEAATALGRAVEIVGAEDPTLSFNYADALVMAGRYDEALEQAKGLSVPAQKALILGRVDLEQGRYAAALDRFTESLTFWPDNAVARYYTALAAEGVGDFERAIEEYRYSIRANPDATDARVRLARLYLAEGSPDLALPVLRHAWQRGGAPDDLDVVLLDLRVVSRLGMAWEISQRLKAMSHQPQVFGRAVAAVAAGVRDRSGSEAAVRVVKRVKGLDLTDPANAVALRELVDDLVRSGSAGEATEIANAAVQAHPDVAIFQAIRGIALEGNGAAPDEVRAAYARALEIDPELAVAHRGMGELGAASGDTDAALDHFAKAEAADPEDTSALRAAAALLASIGRVDDAEAQLERALARDPYDGGVALQLALLVADHGGDAERASKLARRAVRFGAGDDAEALVARLQQTASAADPGQPESGR